MDELRIGDKLIGFRGKFDEDNNYMQVKYSFTVTDDLLLEFANKNIKKFFNFLSKKIDGGNNSNTD